LDRLDGEAFRSFASSRRILIPDTFKILCVPWQRKRADDLDGLASYDRIVGPSSSTFSRWAAFAGDHPWAGVMRATARNPEPLSEFKSRVVPWDY